MIEYFPNLGNELHKLGFKSSSEVFTFLKDSNIEFYYDRDSVKPLDDAVQNSVITFKKLYSSSVNGFVFIMNIPNNFLRVDVIYVDLITKENLLRVLKLKPFS